VAEEAPAEAEDADEDGPGFRPVRAFRGGRAPRRVSPFEEFVDVFCDLICGAQECIRELCGGERSSSSLRDVARCGAWHRGQCLIWLTFGGQRRRPAGVSSYGF
jgi:hypothetical protein